MPKMNVKKDDLVQVLSGKDKGKQGKVLRSLPAIVKKATRPNPNNQAGGIVSQEAAIDVSNVALVCPKCGKPTRVGHQDGKRVCKKCGELF